MIRGMWARVEETAAERFHAMWRPNTDLSSPELRGLQPRKTYWVVDFDEAS